MNGTVRGCGLNISSDGLPGSRRKCLTRATGTQTAVARAGALRRPRELRAERHNLPEAMVRICPGDGSNAFTSFASHCVAGDKRSA